MPQKAVIFDFDGVLADSIGLYHRLYREVAEHYGRPFPPTTPEAFREWYNPKWEENYRALGFTGFLREEAMQWVSQRVDYAHVPLFPGSRDMIWRLAEKYPLGIASTTPSQKIRLVLERDGLSQAFHTIMGGGDEGSDKLKMVGEVWRLLGAPPQRTLMVGDTSMDVQSAHHWKLKSVGVTYGWMSRPRMEAARPTALVHQPARLEETIEDLLGDD